MTLRLYYPKGVICSQEETSTNFTSCLLVNRFVRDFFRPETESWELPFQNTFSMLTNCTVSSPNGSAKDVDAERLWVLIH